MQAVLLGVADRASVAPVVRLPEEEGYAHSQTRAPLRVRSVLNNRRINLIP